MIAFPLRAVAAVVVLAVAAGCSSTNSVALGPPPAGGEYAVVSTTYPLHAIASRLGGARFKAVNLRPEGALETEPLSAAEKAEILKADVLFKLSEGIQPAIDQVAAQRSGPTVVLPRDDQGDPFVWLNPNQMGAMIEVVRQALTAYDPGGAGLFTRNAKRYGATVAMVDKEYSRRLADCERREVVTVDPVFGPLARRYGLTQVDASDPAKLEGAVESYQPKTVFFPVVPTVKDAQRRLAEDGYLSAVLDPIVDQDDHARRGGANYEVLMRLNLDALAFALECTEDAQRN